MNKLTSLVLSTTFLFITSGAHLAGSQVRAWGNNNHNQLDIPASLTNAVAISAFGFHNLALRADGSVVAWGDNTYGESDVPLDLGYAAAVAAGWGFSLALTPGERVVAWGWDVVSQTTFPPDLRNVKAIAAGYDQALALKGDGTVVTWGDNFAGQTNTPPNLSNVVAIAAGGRHNLALKKDGTVVMWGDASSAQRNMPPGLTNIVAIAGGAFHSLALRRNGTVVAWGTNDFGQLNVPPNLSNVVAIAAGQYHNLALRRDGTVVAWGQNDFGQINLPSGLASVGAVSAGISHSLVLTGVRSRILQTLIDQATPGDTITLEPLTYYDNITINKNLILQGVAGQTRVDGHHTRSVITVASNVTVTFNNFIITNGFLHQPDPLVNPTVAGGGILNAGSLQVSNCAVRGCGAQIGHIRSAYGAGIYNSGQLELNDSVVADCGVFHWFDPDMLGGGVYNRGTARIRNSRIVDCKGAYGAGIYNLGQLSLTGSVISNCVSVWDGGGVRNQLTFNATNTTITRNFGGSGGGFRGGGTLVGCSITENGGVNYAGGLHVGDQVFGDTNDVLTLINCTVSGNYCVQGGIGGISNYGNTLLRNCTVISNRSPNIFPQGLSVYTQNSIVGGDKDTAGSLISQGYNLIQNSSNMVITGNLTGNLVNVDARLGPLQNNGGPTLTHALLLSSPAIDAALCGVVDQDQRGIRRPFDVRGINDARDPCDIGAFELVNPRNELPTIACPNSRVVTNSGSGSITIPLTGISAGPPDESWQPLTISVSNSNPALVPSVAVSYVSPQSTGNLNLTLAPGAYGTARITVTLDDSQATNHSVQCGFDLSVVTTPVITSQPASASVALGNTVAFTVQANGSPLLRYQWRHNGTNLNDGETIGGSRSDRLVLADVRAWQAGTYTVLISNDAGSTTSLGATLSMAASVAATQAGLGYTSNGTNSITCRFSYPAARQLFSLLWRPALPAGWTLIGASGDGNPQVAFGEILIVGSLTNNPLTFTYFVRTLDTAGGPRTIAASVEYQLDGMINPATVRALPDPLTLQPFHSADYQEPRGIIDGSEANRVLSYWRAQAYRLDASGLDGYALGTGNTNGSKHTADYRREHWQIDGSEVNRVLSYWRAHCYHADSGGLDGYAPGCVALGPLAFSESPLAVRSASAAVHSSALSYTPGGAFVVTNRIDYDNPLLSLLLRPALPAGWTLLSTEGDGNPELVAGDILWTGTIPPSPINFRYRVQVPASARGPQRVTCGMERHVSGELNPRNELFLPDPLSLYWQPQLSLQIETGRFLLGWETGDTNFVAEGTANLTAPINWQPLEQAPEIREGRIVVIIDQAAAMRFYRLRRN